MESTNSKYKIREPLRTVWNGWVHPAMFLPTVEDLLPLPPRFIFNTLVHWIMIVWSTNKVLIALIYKAARN
jgi:hypothetical protein